MKNKLLFSNKKTEYGIIFYNISRRIPHIFPLSDNVTIKVISNENFVYKLLVLISFRISYKCCLYP